MKIGHCCWSWFLVSHGSVFIFDRTTALVRSLSEFSNYLLVYLQVINPNVEDEDDDDGNNEQTHAGVKSIKIAHCDKKFNLENAGIQSLCQPSSFYVKGHLLDFVLGSGDTEIEDSMERERMACDNLAVLYELVQDRNSKTITFESQHKHIFAAKKWSRLSWE